MTTAESRAETVFGISTVTTGLGVLTYALFPLALPIVILTVVALLPLALPLIPLALVAGLVLVVWVTLRGIGRGVRRMVGRPGSGPPPAVDARSAPARASSRHAAG